MLNFSILHHNDTRISGEAKTFNDLIIAVNAMSAVEPIKCVTIFLNEDGKFIEEV